MAQENPDKTISLPHPHRVEDQIRRRAYELYEARGGEDGHEVEDWLKAEEEITTRKTRPVAA